MLTAREVVVAVTRALPAWSKLVRSHVMQCNDPILTWQLSQLSLPHDQQ